MKYFKAVKRFVLSVYHRRTLKAASTLTGSAVGIEALTPELQAALAIARERAPMVAKYAQLQKHTGGLVQKSMVMAYNQALTDITVLLTKETGMLKKLAAYLPSVRRKKKA